eukprot:264341-Amphidinium_carterae.1
MEALEDLSAKIEKSSADASALEAKISSLASDISKADADLEAATGSLMHQQKSSRSTRDDTESRTESVTAFAKTSCNSE